MKISYKTKIVTLLISCIGDENKLQNENRLEKTNPNLQKTM
jgi:hypothetical protein